MGLLDYFRKPVTGDIIVLINKDNKIIRTFSCPNGIKPDVCARFYDELASKRIQPSDLEGNNINIYQNVYINRQIDDGFQSAGGNESEQPKIIYAPEAYFVVEREFQKKNFISGSPDISDALMQHTNDSLSYQYDNYMHFLHKHKMKDTVRSEEFFMDVVQSLGIEIIPEDMRTNKVWNIAIENGTGLNIAPAKYLSVDYFLKNRLPIEDTCHRLPDIPGGITQKDLLNIFTSKRQQKNILSLENFINMLPESIKGIIDKNYIQNSRLDIMKDFISKRFAREGYYDDTIYGGPGYFEFYKNKNIEFPPTLYPEMKLSVDDWHQLCTISTELISSGYVPKDVIENPDFWNNYQDFIGKGEYLSNPDNQPLLSCDFDEEQVFSKMPKDMLHNPEVQKTLLSINDISIRLFKNHEELSDDVWLQISPNKYENIPQNIREREEFREKAAEAVKDNIQNIQYVPVKFHETWMVEKVIKEDMSLLDTLPTNLIKNTPNIEQKLIEGVTNYRQQNIFFKTDNPGEQGLVAYEQKDAAKTLRFVLLELRTKNVCCAAVAANPANREFVPKELKYNRQENQNNTSQEQSGMRKKHKI